VNTDTRFSLGATRLEAGVLGVDFGVDFEFPDVCHLKVSYRMVFQVDVTPGEDETVLFQKVASRLAPIVSFPYIRETIASLTVKAGASVPILLPVLNVGAIFKPEAISIEGIEAEED
jgi:preprotein translocase subunit SecB